MVARTVAAHEAAGACDGTLRPDLADAALAGYPPQRLAELLDARAFVESRTSSGGTAAARRRELATCAADDLQQHQLRIGHLRTRIQTARDQLLHDAEALLQP